MVPKIILFFNELPFFFCSALANSSKQIRIFVEAQVKYSIIQKENTTALRKRSQRHDLSFKC